MSLEKHDEKDAQRLALKIYGATIVPVFLLLIVSITMFFLSFILFYENIDLLNQQFYGTSTLTLLLPSFFSFAATLLHVSPILFVKNGNKSNSQINLDYLEIIQELRNPTLKKNKTRRALFLIFIILTILSLIGSQIFLHVGVFVLL